MITRSQRIRLGVFVIVAFVILIGSITIIVAPKMLEKRDTYYIAFENVSVTGLQSGSGVKYQGIQVGYVSDITIDPDNLRRIILEVSLDKGIPIKTDTRAEIAFLGITGLKLIELKGGSNESEALLPGEFIQSGRSLAEEITGRAEILTEKTEIILNNLIQVTDSTNAERVLGLIDTVTSAVTEMSAFLKDNKPAFSSTLANAETVSSNLDTLILSAEFFLFNLNELVTSDTLYQIINDLGQVSSELKQAELVVLFQEINNTLLQTNAILQDVEISFAKSRTDLVYTIERMRESADYLNQFSRLISEDPSILVRGMEPKRGPDSKLKR